MSVLECSYVYNSVNLCRRFCCGFPELTWVRWEMEYRKRGRILDFLTLPKAHELLQLLISWDSWKSLEGNIQHAFVSDFGIRYL